MNAEPSVGLDHGPGDATAVTARGEQYVSTGMIDRLGVVGHRQQPLELGVCVGVVGVRANPLTVLIETE